MHAFDTRRCRAVALLVLVNHVACYGWKTQAPLPEQVLRHHAPTAVRIERTDGTMTELSQAMLIGDSIVGIWRKGVGPLERYAIAIANASTIILSLRNGYTTSLRQPQVLGDSLVGWVQGWESVRGGVRLDEIRDARARLADGRDVALRSVTVAGDSLIGFAPHAAWDPANRGAHTAVPLSDVRGVALVKLKPVGTVFAVLGGALMAVTVAGFVACSMQNDCLGGGLTY